MESLLRGHLAVYHRRCKLCGAPATRYATFSFRGSSPQGFDRLACDDDEHVKPHNSSWVLVRVRDTEQAALIRASMRLLAGTISG